MLEKTEMLNLKREDFASIAYGVLGREKVLRFEAKGASMAPFIKDGDILEVTPVNGEEIRVGDVIFYHVGGKHTVAHRVIKRITENGKVVFLAKGDSNTDEGEEVRPEQIMGIVRTIERKGRKIRINYGLNGLLYVFYRNISPMFIKTRRIGGRLLYHIQSFKAYRNLAKRLIRGEIGYQWEPFHNSARYLLARRRDKIIGRATINIFFKTDSHYRGWWIFGMWVDWRYRGLGVASRLTEMLCQFARKKEASDVRLLVFEDRKPALNLYKKLGFCQAHTPQIDKELREEAKKTGRQRIIMKRDLATGSDII